MVTKYSAKEVAKAHNPGIEVLDAIETKKAFLVSLAVGNASTFVVYKNPSRKPEWIPLSELPLHRDEIGEAM